MHPSQESEVEFPWMRAELQYSISALADEEFQQRFWHRYDENSSIVYSFEMALHTLLDDSVVADQGPATIGTILKNSQELIAVQQLIKVSLELIDHIGLRGSFEDAQMSPLWPSVLNAARQARAVLGAPPEFP